MIMKLLSTRRTVVAILMGLAWLGAPSLNAGTNRLFYDFFLRYAVGDTRAENPLDGTEGPKAMASADLNQDGCADLIVGNLDGSLSVLLGQTNGGLQTQILIPANLLMSGLLVGQLHIVRTTRNCASPLIIRA